MRLSKDGADGTQTVAQAVDRFGAYAEIGVDHAIVNMPRVYEPEALELVPALVDQLREITPAGR